MDGLLARDPLSSLILACLTCVARWLLSRRLFEGRAIGHNRPVWGVWGLFLLPRFSPHPFSRPAAVEESGRRAS